MLKRCYSLILMVFFLAGCSHHAKKMAMPAVPVISNSSTQVRQTSAFTEVDVQGRVNVQLHTGYKKPQIILRGDPRDLAQVQSTVKASALYLRLGSGYPRFGQVTIDVQGRLLDRFSYEGAGLVSGDKLQTRFLDLYLANAGTTHLGGSLGVQQLVVKGKGPVQLDGLHSNNLQVTLIGSPKVQLVGEANLSELTINGNGWLSLYWVKSHTLTIRAKKAAKIQLAGIVNRLDVELWDVAQFKGRYLRAQRSFVRTHNKSVAEISAVNHQSNLATDSSDIYYYNIPNTRADFMGFDGSVLNMRERGLYDTEDYTRYNKQFP